MSALGPLASVYVCVWVTGLLMCLSVCHTGVYEQLLARRGPLLEDAVVPGAGVVLGGSGDGAARHALRLRLLASLAAHCRIVVREELALGLAGQVRARTALLLRAGRCLADLSATDSNAGCWNAAGFRCRGKLLLTLPVLPCVTCAHLLLLPPQNAARLRRALHGPRQPGCRPCRPGAALRQ